MIVELGHFTLILALAAALVQMALPAWGARRGDPRLMAVVTVRPKPRKDPISTWPLKMQKSSMRTLLPMRPLIR